MRLSEIDRQSRVWQMVQAWATERLATLRRRNDGDLDLRATDRLRGRIAELQSLLDLGSTTPDPTLPTTD